MTPAAPGRVYVRRAPGGAACVVSVVVTNPFPIETDDAWRARLEEVCRLKVADADFDAGILPTENRKVRSGPEEVEHSLGPELRRVLEAAIPPIAPATLPIVRMGEHEITSAAPLRKRLIAASARAKIAPPITSLAWIGNFALTRAVDAGIPIEVLSRLAGHASVTTTEKHYVSTKMWPQRQLAARTLAALGADPHAVPERPTQSTEKAANGALTSASNAVEK